MPRIPDQLLKSVVYLFQNKEQAREGRGAGGTGFVVAMRSPAGSRLHVVSNSHVVGNGCTTLRINTDDGAEIVELPSSAWVQHPNGDDIAAAELDSASADRPAVNGLPWDDVFPTAERMEELNVGVGDDVFMLGRFAGHPSQQRNQPLARFGNIAMMPGEPIRDGRGLLVEAYLVEMRSIPGFSGSPVFLGIGAGSYRGEKKMMPFYSETIGLLGIDTGHKALMRPVINQTTEEPLTDMVVEQNSAVAIVSPSYKIQEVLEADEFIAE